MMNTGAWAKTAAVMLVVTACDPEEKRRRSDVESTSNEIRADEMRAAWQAFNAATATENWVEVRRLITLQSGVLLEAMTEAAGHAPPGSLPAVDKVYAAAVEPAAEFEPAADTSGGGPVPDGQISIEGDRAKMQFAGEPAVLVHFELYVHRRLKTLRVKHKGRHLRAGEAAKWTRESFCERLSGTVKYPVQPFWQRRAA